MSTGVRATLPCSRGRRRHRPTAHGLSAAFKCDTRPQAQMWQRQHLFKSSCHQLIYRHPSACRSHPSSVFLRICISLARNMGAAEHLPIQLISATASSAVAFSTTAFASTTISTAVFSAAALLTIAWVPAIFRLCSSDDPSAHTWE